MRFINSKHISFSITLSISLLVIQIIEYECTTKKALYPDKWRVKANKDNSTVYQNSTPIWNNASGFESIIQGNNSTTSPNRHNSEIISKKGKHKSKKGFLETVLNYLKKSKMVQNYITNAKKDLSNFIESQQAKLSFAGRQFQLATVKPGWMDSAMVPMAFITFAMFLMDIMQRMFPYYGGGYGWGNHYDNYNNVQLPVADDSTSIKFSSIFGRSSTLRNFFSKNPSQANKQKRPQYNAKNGRAIPQPQQQHQQYQPQQPQHQQNQQQQLQHQQNQQQQLQHQQNQQQQLQYQQQQLQQQLQHNQQQYQQQQLQQGTNLNLVEMGAGEINNNQPSASASTNTEIGINREGEGDVPVNPVPLPLTNSETPLNWDLLLQNQD